MGFRSFLLLMSFATLLAWLAWGVVLFEVNPLESGVLGLVLFYLTLFAASIGTFFLLGVGYRLWIGSQQMLLTREVQTSFRQSILLALVGVTSLAFSASGRWSWGIFLIMIVITLAIEYAFTVVQSSKR
ncbi:hypothetical protein KBA73_01835 [Patescibacteria group bacterium]|nr:hypothetical protein [Patescibacteria group bacterium]